MQSKENVGITALYCRLSREDDKVEKESNSISVQKKLLTQKAKEYGLGNTKVYVDDGVTGTKFDRPGFQKMLDDIDAGYVTTVMVKDLSRLGRDYILSGYYSDVYFPDRNVRFIAVHDMVDSDEGESEIAPFKNVMNEMYARDISRKIKSSHRIRGNMGEPLAPPPYGYIKNPENKKQWIIEPEAAANVRRIYKMCLDGMGNETIARIFQEEKIPNPMAYWQARKQNRGGKHTQTNPYNWCIRADAVEQIVLMQLQKIISLIVEDESAFAQLLADKTSNDIKKEKKMCEVVIQKSTSRIAVVSNLHQKLYEDNASGKVTDEWYMELSHKYETERADLKAKITDLKNRITELDKLQYGKDTFIAAVKQFMEMKTLTRPLLNELIEKIEVYETEGVGKNRTQRVVIFWKFVGYIELPECVPQKNYKADTRQGVAVEYHTQALPA